jgi:hypothetical protein
MRRGLQYIFNLSCFVLVLGFWMGCSSSEEQNDNLTIAEKIAKAHGLEAFSRLSQLHYRFNVQRDTIYFGRSWQWSPKSGEVVFYGSDTVSFNQHLVEEESIKKIDQSFINDKYWLLFPFQLVWDTDVSFEQKDNKIGPITGQEFKHVVVTYTKDGGYTPGDVYELFCDEDWLIREWIFRRGGNVDPTIITTWEGYQDFNGIKIATNHVNADGSFRLWFSDINIQ